MLTVCNDGPARPRATGSSGHGLVGMRERIELYDGSLRAGPTDGRSGWQVEAVIPLLPSLAQR